MISIVFSTRKIDPVYVKHLQISVGVPNPDIIPIENNAQYSLSEAYNMGLEQAKHNIVVFCHDDIIFESLNWGSKFMEHFKRNPEYGVIGVAGTTNLVSGCWWENRKAVCGIVNHTENGLKWVTRFAEDQGKKLRRVIALDGVCFAIDKTKIIHKFDEEFKGFHFYDIAFCFPNFLDGVKLGVCTNIRITHKSVGRTNDTWEDNKKQFEAKYKLHLPCMIEDEFSQTG